MTQKAPAQEWGVISTCREPAPLIVALVAHYLSLGASRFYLFLDEDVPEVRQALGGNPKVEITQCDNAYWRGVSGRRPANIIRRQVENAICVSERAELPWLLHIDADEFLWSDLPVGEILSAVPEDVLFLKVANAERMIRQSDSQDTIFDGLFRMSVPDSWDASLQRKLAKPPLTRRGLSGHSSGKSLFRTGRGLLPGIHSPRLPGIASRELASLQLDSLLLLHFDGLTKAHWQSKLARLANRYAEAPETHKRRMKLKRQEPMRAAQIDYLAKRDHTPEALDNLYTHLKVLTPEEERQLRAFGLLRRVELSIEDSIRKMGIADQVDLTCNAFNAELGLT